MKIHIVRSFLLAFSLICTLLLLTIINYTTTDNRLRVQRIAIEREAMRGRPGRNLAGRVMTASPASVQEYMFMKKTIFDRGKTNNSIFEAKEITNAERTNNSSNSKSDVAKETGKDAEAAKTSEQKTENDRKDGIPVETVPECKPKRALHRMENLFGDKFNTSFDPFMTLSSLHHPDAKRFPLPFGIKGAEGALHGVLGKLPETDIPRSIARLSCRRCVVVGNSGILKGSEMGKTIDEYDVVFRLNVAPVKGYETDIGSKTSVRLIYPESSGLSPEEFSRDWTMLVIPFKSADIQWVDYVVEGRNMAKLKGFWQSTAEFVPKPKKDIRLFNPEIITELSSSLIGLKIGSSGKMEKNVPTSGAMAIMLALRMCDEVSVAGFGYDLTRPESPIHYYGDQKMKLIIGSWTHNIDPEKKMLRKLVEHGVIRDLTKGLR